MTTDQERIRRIYGFGYGEGGIRAATKSDACMISLVGGRSHSAGVTLTRDQWRRLSDFYSYDLSPEGPDAPPPVAPVRPSREAGYDAQWEYERAVCNWQRDCERHSPQNAHKFALAGSEVNLDRYLAADGMRLMAFLSRFLEAGQDPVALVAEVFASAGYDTQGAEFDSEPDEDEEEASAAE